MIRRSVNLSIRSWRFAASLCRFHDKECVVPWLGILHDNISEIKLSSQALRGSKAFHGSFEEATTVQIQLTKHMWNRKPFSGLPSDQFSTSRICQYDWILTKVNYTQWTFSTCKLESLQCTNDVLPVLHQRPRAVPQIYFECLCLPQDLIKAHYSNGLDTQCLIKSWNLRYADCNRIVKHFLALEAFVHLQGSTLDIVA